MPIADLHADGFDDRAGAAFTGVPGGGVQLVRRQHPYLETRTGTGPILTA
ncbi:hypothetical protein [Streptomyces chrestomyceticus]|nr:hypothetical protein [Streptomyces chrestomyceticus]